MILSVRFRRRATATSPLRATGTLYRLRHGATEPERLDIRLVQTSFPGDRAARSTAFGDFAISPDDRDFAVVARGGISVASIDGRDVKRLPHTIGEERDPSFSPDGRRIVYASERDGRWDLYTNRASPTPAKGASPRVRASRKKRLTSGARDAMMPVYAPDGRHIAFVADRSSVRVLDPTDGRDIEVLPAGQNYSYTDWPWPIAWSPDSRWLALPMQPSLDLVNLALVPADGSRPPVRPVPAGADQWNPEWTPDGGLLTWLSDTGRAACRLSWSLVRRFRGGVHVPPRPAGLRAPPDDPGRGRSAGAP